jgi:hypothetical protein
VIRGNGKSEDAGAWFAGHYNGVRVLVTQGRKDIHLILSHLSFYTGLSGWELESS